MMLYGSSRRGGNTDYLADKLSEDLEVTRVYLEQLNISPIVDQRHGEDGFSPVHDDYENLLEDFLNHDIYIFVTPLYWFGMSGQLKMFFDRWSQYKDDKLWNFKEKITGKDAYVITAANDEPLEEVTQPLLNQFKMICEYIGLNYKSEVIGKGSKPLDVKNDNEALDKIDVLKEEIKSLQKVE